MAGFPEPDSEFQHILFCSSFRFSNRAVMPPLLAGDLTADIDRPFLAHTALT